MKSSRENFYFVITVNSLVSVGCFNEYTDMTIELFVYLSEDTLNAKILINMRKMRLGICMALLCCMTGCKNKTQENCSADNATEQLTDDFDKRMDVLFAKGFSIENYDRYKKVSIINPENTKDTIQKYILYTKGINTDSINVDDAIYIQVPIRSMACMSTSVLGMMPILGLNDKIAGVGNSKYVYDNDIVAKIDSGYIKNISDGMSKNYEQIIMLHPDVLVVDDYSSDAKDKDLTDAGINVMYMNNWKEPNVLGRAEWMKVMALLFGETRKADSIFDDIVNRYEEVKKEIGTLKDTVNVIWGMDFKGVWYVPGEYSYVTQLLGDAGCRFEYEKGAKNSTPYPLELIFSRHKKTRIWLCQPSDKIKSVGDMVNTNEKYKYFDAVNNGKIYSDRKRIGRNGGNDIWESGVYRPDILLKDIAKISHPELFPDYELVYWYEMK